MVGGGEVQTILEINNGINDSQYIALQHFV